jgi:hypothetical protein
MEDIKKILDFVLEYHPFFRGKEKEIIEVIEKHRKYDTFVMSEDKKGIRYVCRFNITGQTAHVLDCIVRKDLRNKGIMKDMLVKALFKFPHLRLVSWERELKYPRRKFRFYTIKQLLRSL